MTKKILNFKKKGKKRESNKPGYPAKHTTWIMKMK
jgi:hypothetical protein